MICIGWYYDSQPCSRLDLRQDAKRMMPWLEISSRCGRITEVDCQYDAAIADYLSTSAKIISMNR